MKKETVYTMPYDTAEDIKAAQELRSKLYESFDSVQVYPNGLHEVKIVATNEKPVISRCICAGCGNEHEVAE